MTNRVGEYIDECVAELWASFGYIPKKLMINKSMYREWLGSVEDVNVNYLTTYFSPDQYLLGTGRVTNIYEVEVRCLPS